MKLGALILHVNKATKNPQSARHHPTVLSGLIRKGEGEQEKPYGKYRLARRSRPAQRIVPRAAQSLDGGRPPTARSLARLALAPLAQGQKETVG